MSNLHETLTKVASETYTDPVASAKFVEGFLEKIAAMSRDEAAEATYNLNREKFTHDSSFPNRAVGGIIDSMGKGIGSAAIGLGIQGISTMLSSAAKSQLKTKFLLALDKAIQLNPILRKAKPELVKSYAETIFNFAPHVATDPNLLSSILANVVHGEVMDVMTIKTLTDLESRFVENRGANGFSPKQYV